MLCFGAGTKKVERAVQEIKIVVFYAAYSLYLVVIQTKWA
jgi:hypothetical protein